VADGCNLLFNLAALGWSVAMVWAPHQIEPPLVMYSVLPLSLLLSSSPSSCICTTCASAPTCARPSPPADRRAGLTQHHRQGGGEGLVTRGGAVFFRTPKRVSASLRIEGTLSEALRPRRWLTRHSISSARGQVPVALAAQVPQHTDCPDTQVQVMQILSHHGGTPGLAMQLTIGHNAPMKRTYLDHNAPRRFVPPRGSACLRYGRRRRTRPRPCRGPPGA